MQKISLELELEARRKQADDLKKCLAGDSTSERWKLINFELSQINLRIDRLEVWTGEREEVKPQPIEYNIPKSEW